MSDSTAPLLFELGTEELPPGALTSLSHALTEGIIAGLDKAGIAHGDSTTLAAPRRLAVRIADVAFTQPNREFERRGPALDKAFDANGNPTAAASGFARSCGVEVSELTQLDTDQGRWLAHRGTEIGQPTSALIEGIIQQALNQLPIPKRMRWGSRTVDFVRPVHWIVLLMGDEVIPARFFDLASDRLSYGHRFHHPEPMVIDHPMHYEGALRDAYVLVNPTDRRDHIEQGVRAEGEQLGGHAVIDSDLLDEVNALVEWPVVLSGSFDKSFLRVPPEALISSMQEHQRYFPVRDAEGRLLPQFITVANIASRDPAQVSAGNERVIRPRLADAAFFWDQDRAQTLTDRATGLEHVVFQKSLGSLADKSARVAQIASTYAERFNTDSDLAERAGRLAKADLITEMVGEFPDLQGLMGRYYALEEGQPEAVAIALDEVYRPRFAGDHIANTALGQLLAVAERADTLVGIFAIGKAPTGAKDPFALRRAAVGLLRTLIEGGHAIALQPLFEHAATQQPSAVNAHESIEPLVTFCLERLRGLYHEAGFAAELFEAVRSVLNPADIEPLDFDRRLRACHDFSLLPAAGRLAAANKRIRNLLRKANSSEQTSVASEALIEPAEKGLFKAIEAQKGSVLTLIEGGQYSEALAQLADLADPVDAFFDDVMVMSDNAQLQSNRLALLDQLQQLFLAIADVSALPEPE